MSYDVVWNLLDLSDIAGVDLGAAFGENARLNEGGDASVPDVSNGERKR